MGYRPRSTTERNCAILIAYETGTSVGQLAQTYGLSVITVREIIRQEGHRRDLSQEALYSQLRNGGQ